MTQETELKFQNYWSAGDVEAVNMFDVIVTVRGYNAKKFFKYLLTLHLDYLISENALNPPKVVLEWMKKHSHLLTRENDNEWLK